VTTSQVGGGADPAGQGLVLDDPGGVPRKVLLLSPSAGSTMTCVMTGRTSAEFTIDGRSAPAASAPDTRAVIAFQVDTRDADGTIHYRATIAEIAAVDSGGADPAIVSRMNATLGQLKGLKGTDTVDAHGGSRKSSFDASGIADPTLKSSLESISSQVGNLGTPFPAQAVGVGARWSATRSATINGLTMNTTTRYTLRSRVGTRYALDLVQDAVATPGPAELPNVPAGASASLVSFAIHATATLSGDLTDVAPRSGSSSASGDGVYTISKGATSSRVQEHLTIASTVSPG
jgi:hypothetical protein